MQEIQDDILQRAKQIISLCRNADASANQTVIKLADQGEQLMNIETRLTTIDATLIDTKQNINRLKGITQRVIGRFRTKIHGKIIAKIMLQKKKKEYGLSSLRRRQTNEHSSSDSFIDGQIDEAFYEINNLIHDLKDKAYIMNDQLVGQADRLDQISERMKESTYHIEEQTIDMKKLNQ